MYLEELRTLLARHARPDRTTAIDGLLISKVDRSDPSAPSMTGTVLAVIAQGAKRLALGDRVYAYGAGQFLVASVDLPVTGQFTQADPERPALGFGLTLEPSAIAELLLQAGPGETPAPARARRRGSRSAMPRPRSSTRRSACCASSTSLVTAPCWPHWSNARSCGG